MRKEHASTRIHRFSSKRYVAFGSPFCKRRRWSFFGVLAAEIDCRFRARYARQMTLEFLVSAFVTLLLVVDPVGLVPTFLGITQGIPKRSRPQVAIRAAFIAALILAGSALIGNWLLQTLAISLPAFRIAGGLLLFSIASEMVLGVRTQRQSRDAEQAVKQHAWDIAAFPLAIPLMAGPGAITATVLLAGRASGDMTMLVLLLGAIAAVCLLCYIAFTLARSIAKLIGETANSVLSRLLGVILAALAVQFVIDGGRALLAS